MSERKIPKKLRGRETIFVDAQIYRWRENLRKKGIKLGHNMELAEKKAEYDKAARAMDTDEKIKKRRWF